MIMKYKYAVVLGCLIALLSIGLSVAQTTCPALVSQALQAVGDHCESLPRNNACYGYNLVAAEFAQEVDDDFFVQPADTSALEILESIETAEMNVDQSLWGVAVMNLQANIPNSIPGQSVKFVLLGDVGVESSTNPEEVDANLEAIDVNVNADANVRSAPSLTANVIGGINSGETVPIDGQSDDGEWYRTAVNNRIGWIFNDLLESEDDLTSLPIINNQRRSLMQSFYLRTGVGTPACEEAPPDTLMIQGPQGIEVDFTINGADIRIGSTILIRLLPPGDIMEIIVIDGQVIIPGAAPDGGDLIVPENYRTTTCLSEAEDLGADGNSNDRTVACEWTTPEFVPDAELGLDFCALEELPESLLNYAIDLECPDEAPVQVIIDETTSTIPDPTDEPESDPQGMDMGSLNLCYAGNLWGDGRCNTNFDWNAGFYYGLLEAGKIQLSDIPEPYYIPPTAVPEDEDDDKKPGIRVNFGCGASINEYEVTVNNGASGDTSFTVDYTDSGTGVGSTAGPGSIPGTLNFFLPVSSTAINVSVTVQPSGNTRSLGNRDCN